MLITGGAGYKGLKLAKRLLEEGHEVCVMDNFMNGYESVLHLFDYENVHFTEKDVRNLDKADVSGYDFVFHLAAISGYPACEANPNSAQMINVEATRSLVSLLGKDQVLVYASTTSLYGSSGEICDESSVVTPVSHYGKTKHAGEVICMERENSIAFRFATIFGVAPRMRWDLLPNDFVMRAVQERCLVLLESHCVRTFLHVDDCIEAYLMATTITDKLINKICNVGSDSMNCSKLEIAEKIKKFVEFEIIDSTVADLDVRNFVIDFSRISNLGFKTTRTIDSGIEELVKLFKFYKPSRRFGVI